MPPRKTPSSTSRRKSTTKPPVKKAAPAVTAVSNEERQAKLGAYNTLRAAGVDVPQELATEVEAWIAEENERREAERRIQAERQKVIEEENKTGPWYVRNGYTAAFSLRLDRHTERRRLELKPRGTPGDMHPLEEADLNDPLIQRNCQIGVIEVIPAGEAKRIIAQQTTNMSTRVHTPTAILRNALGQPYAEGAVKTEISWDQQGITVATLDPNQMQGQVEDKRVQVTRTQAGVPAQGERVSEFIPTGGNPAIISQQPQAMTENAKAKIADDIARRRGGEGPVAGLGQGVQVTVEPTRKT